MSPNERVQKALKELHIPLELDDVLRVWEETIRQAEIDAKGACLTAFDIVLSGFRSSVMTRLGQT